jgi:phospholipase C
MEFALFDGWHASLPGPTMPNRAFAASASSHGMGTNDEKTIIKGMPQKSMFRQIEEMGLDYRVYFELVPAVMILKDVRHRDARPRFHAMKQFYVDVAAGDLPELTWLEPRYYNTPNFGADDQHPDHDVGLGETLIKNVYEAVRASPLWEKTALIITYDEHGGFFDHVSPAGSVPNPDGINYVDENGNTLFDFSRHGVRIPTVIVSPWVKKGTLVPAAPEGSGQYEHSSTIATVVHKLFRPQLGHPKPSYLNKRDEWAATFESVFSRLSVPRSDCPLSLPKPVLQTAMGIKTYHAPDGSSIINDLQLELLYVVAGVSEDVTFNSTEAMKWSELTAAKYIQTKMNAYFERNIVEI